MPVFDATRLELGEGPGYDPQSGLLWWFDIEGRQLFTRRDGAGVTRSHGLAVAGSAMAVTEDGRYLLWAEDGLYLCNPDTSALVLHLPVEAENPATRSNDARVHPAGAFWISTMGWQCEPGAGSLYHYRAGRLQRLWSGLTIPNAICFSPDGRRAYFTDTPTRQILQVATDPATGLPVAEPAPFATVAEGGPDGAVTDAAGNLWVTVFGAGLVIGLDPSGQEIGRLTLPAANVTCPAYWGPGAGTMLVTTALYGLTAAERAARPHEGATFAIPAPAPGRFDPAVLL